MVNVIGLPCFRVGGYQSVRGGGTERRRVLVLPYCRRKGMGVVPDACVGYLSESAAARSQDDVTATTRKRREGDFVP